MARRKRTSIVLEKSGRRLAGMESIDPQLDLGNGLSLSAFSRVIEILRAKENAYNTALSSLDKLYQDMLETESQLSDLAEHMLLGVAARYGRSSVEYGMAGGVPKGQRRQGLRGESLPRTRTTSDSPNGTQAIATH